VGKIAEKAVCRTIWHSILNAELTKSTPASDCFLAVLPTRPTSELLKFKILLLFVYFDQDQDLQFATETTDNATVNATLPVNRAVSVKLDIMACLKAIQTAA